METEVKIEQLKQKYEKKLQIVEKDIKLSDVEKQKVYKKLQKQIRREQAKNIRRGDFKDKLVNFSEYIAGDYYFNKIFGSVGLAVIAIGIFGFLRNPNAISLSFLLGSAPVGLLAMYNTYLNEPDQEGNTILDQIGEEDFDKRIAINDALEEMCKKIPNIKTKTLEPEGR